MCARVSRKNRGFDAGRLLKPEIAVPVRQVVKRYIPGLCRGKCGANILRRNREDDTRKPIYV